MTAACVLLLASACSGKDEPSNGEEVAPTDVTENPADQETAPEAESIDDLGAADPGAVADLPPEQIEEPYVPVKTDYPPPPYGGIPGAVIKNHKFLDPDNDVTVRLSDLYKHPEKKVLLLNSSAGWCSVCKQELVELKGVYTEYAPKGLEIWYTLFQDYEGAKPDIAFYKDWVAKLKPNFPNLLDADFELGTYFNVEATPMNMIIRLDTMEIIYLQTGFDKVGVVTKIKQVLQ